MKFVTAILTLSMIVIPLCKADDSALSPALLERLRTEAPPERAETKPSRVWKTSLAVLAVAAAADAASSWNKRELNRFLGNSQGRFGARGLAIKSLITGGAIGGQWLLVRRSPAASKPAAIANFGMSGIFTAATVHNLGNRKAPATLK